MRGGHPEFVYVIAYSDSDVFRSESTPRIQAEFPRTLEHAAGVMPYLLRTAGPSTALQHHQLR